MTEIPDFDCFALTDKGLKRPVNEDAYVCNPDIGLFLVADGMGGASSGEVASRMTSEIFEKHISAYVSDEDATIPFEHAGGEDFFLKAMEHAADTVNRTVLDAAETNILNKGMGSTLTAVLVRGQSMYVVHVGDSRLYMLENGQPRQITEDHTVVQEMVKKSLLSLKDARNHKQRHVITRCVGRKKRLKPDVFTMETAPGILYLLCSDGLFDGVTDDEIGNILNRQDPQTAAGQLVALANDRGGRDNITVVLFRQRPVTDSEG